MHLELTVTELRELIGTGDGLMASIENLEQAIGELESTLEQELTEIAEALQAASGSGGPAQEEVDAATNRVLALKDRVANIIHPPEEPPAPEPEPEPDPAPAEDPAA